MLGQFNQLWKMFIRPTRQEYTTQDLGFEIQVFKKFKAKRIDTVILNKKGLKLQCSLFEPSSLNPEHNKHLNDKYPCVVYCHCNSGSRMEALRLLPDMIDRGVALFCFDFSGSGLSEGEYVTLGVNESQDLECVVEYLYSTGKISNIALWGRSMGAVTTFLYTSKNSQKKPLKGIVFDSGFSNLNFLAMDLAKQKTGMPNLIIEPALSLISDQVKERVELNIQSIDLAKILHNMYIPVYFVCSKEDTFVRCEHSEQLYHRYNGQKWLCYVNGDHNAPRSSETIGMLADWISNQLFERNQDHLEQSKGQSGFPRKNALTAVAKIDLGSLESPQQSQQQIQQRKGSYQISPGLPIDQRRSPRSNAYNSSQPSPSARLDTRSVSPILMNPLRQQQQPGTTTTTTSQGNQQQQNHLLQQLADHGIPTEKYSSYISGPQDKQSEQQLHSKNIFPPTLNAYTHVQDRTKSPGFAQHSPTIRGYSSIGSQLPFKINLQAAPQSPKAGKQQSFQYPNNISYQSPNLHGDGKINQSTTSPAISQLQESPRKQHSNQLPQQYQSVNQELQQIQPEEKRLSLKQQQIIEQSVQEKTSQSQQESIGSQSRIPTEENSSISGNAGNCGVRGNSAQHGYSFLSNPNEELISYDRNSTPSRKPPLAPTGTQNNSNNNNQQNKQEESSQDSSNSLQPPKKNQDSQSQQSYEKVDEKIKQDNNISKQALSTVDNESKQISDQQQQPQIPKQHNKIQVAPIILPQSTLINGNNEGLETPQFLIEKRQNILLQTDDSPFSSPGLIAQEQPLDCIPQPLQYTNTRNLSRFSQAKQISPRNNEVNQEKPLNNQQPQSQQQESKPQQSSPPQQQQQTQSQQAQTNQHRSVRSSTYSSSTTPTHSSTQIPSNSNININNPIGPAFQQRQRNTESSKSEIPQNLGDINSPRLTYQTSSPRNKEPQPSNSNFSQASSSQQQDFLSIKPNFLSSYSHAMPNQPLGNNISNNTQLGGNIRIRPQNNSLDITNSLGFLQDLSKNNIPGQIGYLGGTNYQSQKGNKLMTFSTNKSQETSAALASIPLISQDHQKPPIFEHHMKTTSMFTGSGKTTGFDLTNQKQSNTNNLSNGSSQVGQYQYSSSQQQQQQQQQDKKNQVKVVGISIVSPRQQQQQTKQSTSQQEYEHHKSLSQQQQVYQQYFPKDSSIRVQTESTSYSSVGTAADQVLKGQNNQGKEQPKFIPKEPTNYKEIAPHNSLCNTPAGGNRNGVVDNSTQVKSNLEANTNINNYSTNPVTSGNTNNNPKNPGTGFSLGPSKYFTTYDAQSYPQQEALQKPSQQTQQQQQQTFSELSQKFAFATQVSPVIKQTYSLANTPKLSQQQQQSKQSLQSQAPPQHQRSYFETHLPSASNQQIKSYNSSNPYNIINNNTNNYYTNQQPNNLPSSSHTSHSSSTNNSMLYNNTQLGMPMTTSKGMPSNPDLLKQPFQQSQQKYNLPQTQQQQQTGTSNSNTNVQSNK